MATKLRPMKPRDRPSARRGRRPRSSDTRTCSPADLLGFEGFSPYTLPNVIEISEGIPYIDMTDWDHEKLYELKGKVVSIGIKEITGLDMPVFEKRRFQHGAASKELFERLFPKRDIDYRKEFHSRYE